LLVQPDLVVGAGLRQELQRQLLRPLVHLRVQAGQQRVAAAEHVAVDVAAGGDGVQRGGVDGLHGRLQLALDHAVELEGLAGGDAQRVVGEAGGDGVEPEDRKSTRLNSSHAKMSYAVACLKKKKT